MGQVVEAVERALGRDLPVALAPFPAIFGAGDALAGVGDGEEAAAGVGIAIGEFGSDALLERVVVVAGEADQLQPAADQGELIVAAELPDPFVLVVGDSPDPVDQARAGAGARSR